MADQASTHTLITSAAVTTWPIIKSGSWTHP